MIPLWSSTSSGSSNVDPKHAKRKSNFIEKEVVVGKKGCKLAAKTAPMPPPQGEDVDPLASKAKRATKKHQRKLRHVPRRLRLFQRKA